VIEAYLSGQLASFRALMLLVGLGYLTCKIVPEMTYKVSSGTLSLYTLDGWGTPKKRN